MRIKEGFKLLKVGDRSVVVKVGKNNDNFNGIIHLNETSAFIWKMIEEYVTTDIDFLTEKLVDEFEVSFSVAKKDIENVILKLKEANVLI